MPKRTLSKLQKAYRDFFLDKMEEYEVTSPSQLDNDEKIEFFNAIKKDWKKQKKTMGESFDINSIINKILKEEEKPKSGNREQFRKYFNTVLDKFDVDSPDDLDDKGKVDFFNTIDKGWKSQKETKKESFSKNNNVDPDYVMDKEDKEDKEDKKDKKDKTDDQIEEDDCMYEETSTADMAVPDLPAANKISKKEHDIVSEICKSRKFSLVKAKIVKEGLLKMIVERYNQKDVVYFDDNEPNKPFYTSNKAFSILEHALDYIVNHNNRVDKNAQNYYDTQLKKQIKESKEKTNYNKQTLNLPEQERLRRDTRTIELVEKLIQPIKHYGTKW